MRKILTIAEREFLETVKTKAFILSLILTPLLIVGVLFITTRAQQSIMGPRPPKQLAVTDLTGRLAKDLEAQFEQYNGANSERKIVLSLQPADPATSASVFDAMKEKIRKGELDAYFVVAKDAIDSQGASQYFSKTRSFGDIEFFGTVRNLIQEAVISHRYAANNVSPELIATLRKPVNVEQVDLSTETEAKREPMTILMIPFFFILLMFIGIFGTNQQMLTSVIEEKSSRVMEVLLSAVSPFQLMAGKIVGLALVGFVLVAVWGGAAFAAALYRGLTGLMPLSLMVYFVIYFVLGFLLISSILAAIGSACNTVKEAQSLMGPITMVLTMPMILWFWIAQHPQGWLAVILSYIPPITPMIMILRIAANPELRFIEIFATIVMLAVSVPVVMWASAKIFRTGILMYGKPPSMRELARWLQYR